MIIDIQPSLERLGTLNGENVTLSWDREGIAITASVEFVDKNSECAFFWGT